MCITQQLSIFLSELKDIPEIMQTTIYQGFNYFKSSLLAQFCIYHQDRAPVKKLNFWIPVSWNPISNDSIYFRFVPTPLY